jgi:hypothetical protein
MTVRRIEEGCDPLVYDMRFLAGFAGALGVEFSDLFDWDTPPARGTRGGSDDVERAGAVLAGSGGRATIDALATALAWTIERTRLALAGLEVAVTGAGMRLIWFADTEVLLAPVDGVAVEVESQIASAIVTGGMNVAEFEVICQLARSGPVRHRSASNVNVLSRLISAGAVQVERTGREGRDSRQVTEVQLTDAARFDLCLDGA